MISFLHPLRMTPMADKISPMQAESHRLAVSEHLLFQGRPGDPRLGEWVMRGEWGNLIADKRETIGIWGCPDDTGVVRNRGRAGAKEGPDSIRKHLYRMAMPMDLEWEKSLRVIDFGNLIPAKGIRETHERNQNLVEMLAAKGITLICLGGGHDFAASNFSGFVKGRKEIVRKAQGTCLINIDPHLDVRELEESLPHSGTPFREILNGGFIPGKSFVQFGTRANRNARAHYQYCLEQKIKVLDLDAMRSSGKPLEKLFKTELDRLAKSHGTVATTFDLDCCSDAEGMSAAPVLGITAWELAAMADFAGREKKVRYLEIAEVAPSLDFQERSSRIAAEMIYRFLRARAGRSTNLKKS